MTDEEQSEKIEKINAILESKGITILDDYWHDVFRDKDGKDLFRVKSKRTFESQEDANAALIETLQKLQEYDK